MPDVTPRSRTGNPDRRAVQQAPGALTARAVREQLRERLARARHESDRLARTVVAAAARSAMVCASIQQERAAWRAWHLGMHVLREHGTACSPLPLRVCMGCHAVAFGGADAPGAHDEAWIEPPSAVRRQLRLGALRDVVCSHGVCAPCLRRLYPDIADEVLELLAVPSAGAPVPGPVQAPAPTSPSPSAPIPVPPSIPTAVASALAARVFAQIERAAEALVPELQRSAPADSDAMLREQAREQVLAEVVERVAAELSHDERQALLRELRTIVRGLGGSSRTSPGHARSRPRFTPPLRRG